MAPAGFVSGGFNMAQGKTFAIALFPTGELGVVFRTGF